eukprot:jgi/Mesen1/9592/ME000657S08874
MAAMYCHAIVTGQCWVGRRMPSLTQDKVKQNCPLTTSRHVRSKQLCLRVRAQQEPGEATPAVSDRSKDDSPASKSSVSGTGFGNASASPPRPLTSGSPLDKEKRRKGARRPAPEKPLLAAEPTEEERQIESAAVASLGVIFLLIMVEGLLLAASGFLPDEWDDVIVKYVYGSFSPTVGLFLLGAVLYGLYKYLGTGAGGPPKS